MAAATEVTHDLAGSLLLSLSEQTTSGRTKNNNQLNDQGKITNQTHMNKILPF